MTKQEVFMTGQLIEEDRVPLAELAAQLGVDRKTVCRWADIGYRGQRLEAYRIGKKRHSSWEAARRFLAAVNGGKVCGADPQPKPPC